MYIYVAKMDTCTCTYHSHMYPYPPPTHTTPPPLHTHIPPGGPIITGCGCGPPGWPWGGWWGGGGSWPPGGIPGRFIQGGRWGPGSGGLIPWGLLPPVCNRRNMSYQYMMPCSEMQNFLSDSTVICYQLTIARSLILETFSNTKCFSHP